jgi:DNA-binding IclR family transcriptional regulator
MPGPSSGPEKTPPGAGEHRAGEAPAAQAGGQEKPSGTVTRVVRVLAAIADAAGPAGVVELAESVQLPVSTVHRMLNLLRDQGLVHMEPAMHRYSAGPEFYRLAARVVSKMEITTLAQPLLQQLVDRFNETILLGLHMAAQHSLMFVARVDGSQALQYRIDLFRPLSLVWGASGKALLAFLDQETIEQTIAAEGPGPVSGRPVPPRKEIFAELECIRAQGYSVSEEEKLPGARGVAVPVFNPTGAIGSLCLTSPRERVPHGSTEDMASHLISAAGELSRLLGSTADTR